MKKITKNLYLPFILPYILFLIVFVILPMVFIVVYSLNESSSIQNFSISASNYTKFFETNLYIKCIGKSIYLALVSTIICFLVCYPIAYFISKRKKKTQAYLILLVTAPMWINTLLRVMAIKQILDGPLLTLVKFLNPDVSVIIGNDPSVIFGMVYNYIPYMILPIYTILSKMDDKLLEASTDLGAKSLHTFLHVIFPLSLSGVLSGVTITFLGCTTTITISKYLGEGRYFLIGNLIENEFITNNRWGFGSAISLILLVFIMIILFAVNKYNKEEE